VFSIAWQMQCSSTQGLLDGCCRQWLADDGRSQFLVAHPAPVPACVAEGCSKSNGFRYFWLTDSCPQTVRSVEAASPFEVLTLAGPIAAALQI
jgi:hypothetical protein